jgi:hypothetical protein
MLKERIFRRWVMPIVLGMMLAVATILIGGVMRGWTQEDPFQQFFEKFFGKTQSKDSKALPDDIQKLFDEIRQRLPPDGRDDAKEYGTKAIEQLTDAQMDEQIEKIRTTVRRVGRETTIIFALLLDGIRRHLPKEAQQPFVNGMWGVSERETQWMEQIVFAVVEPLKARSGDGLGGAREWVREWRRGRDEYICSLDNRYSFCQPRWR